MFIDRRSWLKTTGLLALDKVAPAGPMPRERDSQVASKALAIAETIPAKYAASSGAASSRFGASRTVHQPPGSAGSCRRPALRHGATSGPRSLTGT